MTKIAVIDLRYTYPPTGGAGVDLVETFTRLSSYDTCIFRPTWPTPWTSPCPKPSHVSPLPIQYVHSTRATRTDIVHQTARKIEQWSPDLIFMADGWTLKPYLIRALRKQAPLVLRLYAFEMLCPRNNERWLGDKVCDHTVLSSPEHCLSCARGYRKEVQERRGEDGNALTHEAEVAGLWNGDYANAVYDAFAADRVMVYNRSIARYLQTHLSVRSEVIPGGVDVAYFSPIQRHTTNVSCIKILVPGRMGDPAKGAQSAFQAGALLRKMGFPVHMTITCKKQRDEPWLTEIGWVSKDRLRELLNQSDIVVVPSRWEEAFGIAWAEAMAMKKPVVVSRTAGPLDYLENDVHALMFDPENTHHLASQLERLIQDSSLRNQIANNGHELIHEQFTWEKDSKKDTSGTGGRTSRNSSRFKLSNSSEVDFMTPLGRKLRPQLKIGFDSHFGPSHHLWRRYRFQKYTSARTKLQAYLL